MRWHAYTSGTPLVLLPAQGRVEEEGEVGEAHVVALENLGAVLRVGEDGHCVRARVCARIHTQLFTYTTTWLAVLQLLGCSTAPLLRRRAVADNLARRLCCLVPPFTTH